jgi:hypothetical protein
MHPEIAAERLEELARLTFPAVVAALAHALASKLAENPEVGAAELRAALEGEGHAPIVTAVLEKLRRAGLSGLAERSRAEAEEIWEDAHHLRLLAGTLSIERQAAAVALGRETSEVHLSRLRDIQEQVSRSLRPDNRDATGEAGIVHPFKQR